MGGNVQKGAEGLRPPLLRVSPSLSKRLGLWPFGCKELGEREGQEADKQPHSAESGLPCTHQADCRLDVLPGSRLLLSAIKRVLNASARCPCTTLLMISCNCAAGIRTLCSTHWLDITTALE